jgi:Tfp pilus assembly protein PilX
MIKSMHSETGFVLVTALAVMAIALGLAAAAIAWSVDSNSLTTRDANSKAALAAADAGLRVAAYRLSEIQPAANSCPTEPSNAAVAANGLCAMDGPESLGNGATFEYWISRAMVIGDTCVGPTVDNSQSDVSQRCITAVGTVNGVSERVQERVAQYTSTPVFPTAIFGTKSVTISNNETIISDTSDPALIGTNGLLTAGGANGGGTTVIDGYSLPPGASLQMGQNVINNDPNVPGRLTPYPVPGVSMSTTATNTAVGGSCVVAAGSVQTNCDYRLTPTCATLYVGGCDSYSGTVIFDSSQRTLYLGNNASVTLAGGYYNFCSLYLSNNSQISIVTSNTAIYIDSPQDSGSNCSTSNSAQGVAPGTFTMTQNSTLNAGGSALAAQIYVYGDQTDTPPTNNVTMNNNGSSAFALDAPFSNVNLSPSNNTIFKGAINGYTVTIGNAGHFTYEADTASLENPALYPYYRSYWEQCAGAGSPSAPTTGC